MEDGKKAREITKRQSNKVTSGFQVSEKQLLEYGL